MDNMENHEANAAASTSGLRTALTANDRHILTVLYDCEDYFINLADVIDGDYGQPRANREMTLLGEVRLAISMMERGK